MTSTLPPSLMPVDTRQDKPAPPRHAKRDFANHLPKHDESEQGHEKGKRLVNAPMSASQDAAEAVSTVATVMKEGADASVLYPQSLRVIGYLSMLGKQRAPVGDVEATGSVRVASPYAATSRMASAPTERGAASGEPTSSEHALAVVTAQDLTLASADEPVAASSLSGTTGADARRFSRRFVKLAGNRLLLRDFTLSPDQVRSVLDAFSSLATAQGQSVDTASINGVAYRRSSDGTTFKEIRMDDHVG